MKQNLSLLLGALLLAPTLVTAQSPSDINPACPENATKPVAPGTNQSPNYVAENPNAPQSPYPDFGFMVTPAEYLGCWSDQPIFQLKTDYPGDLPDQLPPFMEMDFRANTEAYLLAVRDYSFAGNLPDWDPHNNTQANWYHIPWLHTSTSAYPPNGGTEGFRGLIKEAPVSPGQLGSGQMGQDGNYSVYAITLVNEQAGYTLGRMWEDPQAPNPEATDRRFGGGFPVGTVFAKLLFTDAPKGVDHLPFLENPLSWLAYITPDFWTTPSRAVQQVNLLQMDIAVRDDRAGETGWILGTFAYNGQLGRENKFENLVPVGLMWGNDPDNRVNKTTPFPPMKTEVNTNLKETIIVDSADLPPQHLGWNGRLNGPADLNTTSCMSCHINAQYPAITSLVPAGAVPDGGPMPPANAGSDEWMLWFQNVAAGTSTNDAAYSTDFSFQVAIALTNFFEARDVADQGMRAAEFGILPLPIQRGFRD